MENINPQNSSATNVLAPSKAESGVSIHTAPKLILPSRITLPVAPGGWLLVASAGLFAAGLWCMRFQLTDLWLLWTSDQLRSIGMLVPPVSMLLVTRALAREDWHKGGSWWGLAVVTLALGLAILDSRLRISWGTFIGKHVASFHLIPPGVLISAYASGMVLLVGGPHIWRKAAFPLILLLAVNPVPAFFSSLVDLQLQRTAAHSARAFAAFLHIPVSEGTLKMMFAPQLGMFIAPGCDGLRGATTMGMLALVSGYLFRLPVVRWIGYVVSAILLAYLFNLLRLSLVVVYYWLALRFPSIGHIGTEVDYAIGGTLFCLACVFLVGMPRRLVTRSE